MIGNELRVIWRLYDAQLVWQVRQITPERRDMNAMYSIDPTRKVDGSVFGTHYRSREQIEQLISTGLMVVCDG